MKAQARHVAVDPTHKGTSKNVIEAASARQKQAKKRSLRVVNEHFERVFNAAMATQIVFRDAQTAQPAG
ncbi:hypothetical protein [Pseudomonas sp. C11]|jgi:hypothetical protein|uniref:hypothetical protein n=1 Tax=Pseudomonas sp. C11 TaxID=3075550 RepID=UPI002AFFC74B|nr:hypothetical protein [Pseudomonas sp. C11]